MMPAVIYQAAYRMHCIDAAYCYTLHVPWSLCLYVLGTLVSDWCAAAHWRHLANTIERFVHGGDAALCQVTVITG